MVGRPRPDLPLTASPTLRQLLALGRQRLEAAENPAGAPRLEAELLLANIFGKDRGYLFAHADDPAPETAMHAYGDLIDRRARGEPIAYITGEQEFWSLPLEVNESVLVPRPETELLVELALERLPADRETRVADIGTGSGAIALALARERPLADVIGTDISPDALKLAGKNAARLAISNVRFLPGAWCAPLQGTWQLIVSNPPYIAEGDPHLSRGDLRFEPRIALTPGRDGLSAFRTLAGEARSHLRPGGWLLFEHGFDQAEALRELLSDSGFTGIQTRQDFNGLDRVTLGQRPA